MNPVLQGLGILLLAIVALVVQKGMQVTPEMKNVTLSGGPIVLVSEQALDASPRCGPDAELEGCAEELPELASHDAGVPEDAEVDAWVDPDAWTEMWGRSTMSTNSNPDLSGAAARRLTMEGLKKKFQEQRTLEAWFGRSKLEVDVPFSYQREFLEYVVGLTGYTILWYSCSTKIEISW